MSPTQHFLYPDTDPRHRKAVEEAVNAQESEPQDVLAEALHDAMCDISHHDRPPARCSKWATYPNIAASVLPRLRAALVRTPETPERDPARTFTYWFLQQPVQRQREFVKSVFPDAFRTPETLDVAGLRREIEALPDVNPTPTVDTGTATDWPMVKRADVLRLTRQARERELVDPSGKDPTPRFHDTYLAASPAPDPGDLRSRVRAWIESDRNTYALEAILDE